MMKFRAKSIVVEANQVPATSTDPMAWGRLSVFLGPGGPWEMINGREGMGVDIKTAGGVLHASPGDWIVKSETGELRPIKREAFAKTYEPA